MSAKVEKVLEYEDAIAKFDPVMGLEVHVELNTNSKMFCGCPTEFGGDPNTHVCPVCLGLPGALPVVNGKAVESAIRIGLALNCEIAEWCRFARKNYFYPDMPKNFQTSQYDEPICFNGYLDVDVETDEGVKKFRVEIERAHMEEDTGKLVHGTHQGNQDQPDVVLHEFQRHAPLHGFAAGGRWRRAARAFAEQPAILGEHPGPRQTGSRRHLPCAG